MSKQIQIILKYHPVLKVCWWHFMTYSFIFHLKIMHCNMLNMSWCPSTVHVLENSSVVIQNHIFFVSSKIFLEPTPRECLQFCLQLVAGTFTKLCAFCLFSVFLNLYLLLTSLFGSSLRQEFHTAPLLSRKQEEGEEKDWEKWLDSRIIRVFSSLNGFL